MKPITIIDRGRGPELAGTRITVFDVLPHFQEGWHHSSIALWFGLSSAQVLALHAYFKEHEAEVLAADRAIRERHARGNPPEVQARLREGRVRWQALRERLSRQPREGANGAGNPE